MAEGIEFEEDVLFKKSPNNQFQSASVQQSYQTNNSFYQAEQKGMAGWLIKHNIVKSGTGAQAILLGLIVFNIIVTILVVIFLL